MFVLSVDPSNQARERREIYRRSGAPARLARAPRVEARRAL